MRLGIQTEHILARLPEKSAIMGAAIWKLEPNFQNILNKTKVDTETVSAFFFLCNKTSHFLFLTQLARKKPPMRKANPAI